jgi:hypothetical protein
MTAFSHYYRAARYSRHPVIASIWIALGLKLSSDPTVGMRKLWREKLTQSAEVFKDHRDMLAWLASQWESEKLGPLPDRLKPWGSWVAPVPTAKAETKPINDDAPLSPAAEAIARALRGEG